MKSLGFQTEHWLQYCISYFSQRLLELCRGKRQVNLEDIQPYLDRIRAPRVNEVKSCSEPHLEFVETSRLHLN